MLNRIAFIRCSEDYSAQLFHFIVIVVNNSFSPMWNSPEVLLSLFCVIEQSWLTPQTQATFYHIHHLDITQDNWIKLKPKTHLFVQTLFAVLFKTFHIKCIVHYILTYVKCIFTRAYSFVAWFGCICFLGIKTWLSALLIFALRS